MLNTSLKFRYSLETFVAPARHQQVDILFQDKNFLLINKPTGLQSLSGNSSQKSDSVQDRLLQDFPSAALVHRLDFGTSGIMLIALNKTYNDLLSEQFHKQTVIQTFTAILRGHLPRNIGAIDFPIANNPMGYPKLKLCDDNSMPAVTQFEVLERLKKPFTTRVKYTPLTTRTHQMRIHSCEIGHPILGCDLYAPDEIYAMSYRLMLHATTLEFDHPLTGERIFCNSPPPF